MTRIKGPLRWAAIFAAISALLHLLGLLISFVSASAVWLAPFGLIYAGFAYGLLQGWRWLGYVAFVVLLIGTSVAIGNIWALGAVPGWLFGAIAVINLLAVASLFIALWKAPEPA